MSLIDKLTKNSTIKLTAPINESKVFDKKTPVLTDVPMINVALGGHVAGGLTAGTLMLAGPSKHFKTAFALLMAAAFQRTYEDAVILFYDSEFGSPRSYFESFGIDMTRVVHTPLINIEELKFDIVQQLEGIERGEHVLILIDSIGNLASKKEVEDAMNNKSVADMTRAKQLKSLFRMVTPYLNLKNLPLIAVNHTYKEIGLFPKDIVSGGTGAYYSADAIWIIGRQQDKVQSSKELLGYKFIINIEKSRHVKEKSKIPITVGFEGGMIKWSGLFDVAKEGGYINNPKQGWYEPVNPATGEVMSDKLLREGDINKSKEFWMNMFEKTDFTDYIKNKYTVAHGKILADDADEIDLDTLIEDDK